MKLNLARIWRLLNLPKNLQLFIMRFFNDSFLVGVTGIILNDKNEILLLKHTYRQTSWSLPGGYLKGREHPHVGIAREILEETGLKVKVEKIVKTAHDHTNARLDITCLGIFHGGTFKPTAEVVEHGFFEFSKLPDIGKNQKQLIEKILKRENKYFHQKPSLRKRITGFFKRN